MNRQYLLPRITAIFLTLSLFLPSQEGRVVPVVLPRTFCFAKAKHAGQRGATDYALRVQNPRDNTGLEEDLEAALTPAATPATQVPGSPAPREAGLEEVTEAEVAAVRTQIEAHSVAADISIPAQARVVAFAQKGPLERVAVTATAWNEVFAQLDTLSRRYVMIPFPIEDGDVTTYRTLIRVMKHGLTFANGAVLVAANVGAPFKTVGVDLLEVRDPKVDQGRATSLLVRQGHGTAWGTVNDGEALADAIEDQGERLQGRKVVLLGVGGVGYPFAWAARARGISELVVADPIQENIDRLLSEAAHAGFPITAVAPDDPASGTHSSELHHHLAEADVVINAADYGRPHRPGSPLVDPVYRGGATLVDLTARAFLEPGNFLEQAERTGTPLHLADGTGMLIHANAAQVWDLLRQLGDARGLKKSELRALFRQAFIRRGIIPVEEGGPPGAGLEEGVERLVEAGLKRVRRRVRNELGGEIRGPWGDPQYHVLHPGLANDKWQRDLECLMDALLDWKDPKDIGDEDVRKIHDILRLIDKDVLRPLRRARVATALTLPTADHWLASRVTHLYNYTELLKSRVRSMAQYSTPGAGLILGALGPHLRGSYTLGYEQVDLEIYPFLLAPVLRRLNQLLPDMETGTTARAEAEQYAGLLLSGLQIPLTDLETYKEFLTGVLADPLVTQAVNDPWVVIAQTAAAFPRFLTGERPEDLEFRNHMAGMPYEDIVSLDRINGKLENDAPISLWDLYCGGAAGDAHRREILERRGYDPHLINQISQYLLQRSSAAITTAPRESVPGTKGTGSPAAPRGAGLEEGGAQASERILESVKTYGLLSPADQAAHGLRPYGSVDYEYHRLENQPLNTGISVYPVIADSQSSNETVARSAILGEDYGSLSVILERPFDGDINLMGLPPAERRRILEERARWGVVALIDPTRLAPRDRKVVAQPHEEPERRVAGPVPLAAIRLLLVPRSIEPLVRQALPSLAPEQIISVNDQEAQMWIARKIPGNRPWVYESQEELMTLSVPAYWPVIQQELDRLPRGTMLAVHGLRLVAPSEVMTRVVASAAAAVMQRGIVWSRLVVVDASALDDPQLAWAVAEAQKFHTFTDRAVVWGAPRRPDSWPGLQSIQQAAQLALLRQAPDVPSLTHVMFLGSGAQAREVQNTVRKHNPALKFQVRSPSRKAWWEALGVSKLMAKILADQMPTPPPGAGLEEDIKLPSAARELPAREFLAAVGLGDLETVMPLIVGVKQVPFDGEPLTIVTFRLPPERSVDATTGLATGLSILSSELGKRERYDLVYHGDRLISVVMPPADQSGSLYDGFDLAALHFRPPAPGEANAAETWRAFAAQWKNDRQALAHYLSTRHIWVQEASLALVRLQKQTGEITITRLNPGDIWKEWRLWTPDPAYHQMVIPVSPGLYWPGQYDWKDTDYYTGLYLKLQALHREVPPDQWAAFKSLSVGPGSGITSWIVQLVTQAKRLWVSGLSPIEVANARVVGHLAGFDVESQVYDNVVSTDGTPAFPEQRFHLVEWHIPWLTRWTPESTQQPGQTYDARQEHDSGGHLLRRFATGVAQVLDPSPWSRVIVSNRPSYIPQVMETFGNAGFVRDDDIRGPNENFFSFRQEAPVTPRGTGLEESRVVNGGQRMPTWIMYDREHVQRMLYPAAGHDAETVVNYLDRFPGLTDVYLVDPKYSKMGTPEDTYLEFFEHSSELTFGKIELALNGGFDVHATYHGRSITLHFRAQDFLNGAPPSDERTFDLVVVNFPGTNSTLSTSKLFWEKVVEATAFGGLVAVSDAFLPSSKILGLERLFPHNIPEGLRRIGPDSVVLYERQKLEGERSTGARGAGLEERRFEEKLLGAGA